MEESRETKLGKIIYVQESSTLKIFYKVVIKLKESNEYVMVNYKPTTHKIVNLNEISKYINLESAYNDTSNLHVYSKKFLLDYWNKYTSNNFKLENALLTEERREKIDKLFNSDEL